MNAYLGKRIKRKQSLTKNRNEEEREVKDEIKAKDN